MGDGRWRCHSASPCQPPRRCLDSGMARMTAAERREQLISIASEEFAHRGFHGTSMEAIARRADVAQPYVFQLFGSKRDLFRRVIAGCYEQLITSFGVAAEGLRGTDALVAMGGCYRTLLTDRKFLLLQLQGFAACDDPEIQATVRSGFGAMWQTITDLSGADSARVKRFVSIGMLLNDAAAMDLDGLDEDWAVSCVAPVPRELL
jgi:AcrR family transcriptional regulator